MRFRFILKSLLLKEHLSYYYRPLQSRGDSNNPYILKLVLLLIMQLLNLYERVYSKLFTLFLMPRWHFWEYNLIMYLIYTQPPIRYSRSQLSITFVQGLQLVLKEVILLISYKSIMMQQHLTLQLRYHHLVNFLTVLRIQLLRLAQELFNRAQEHIMHLFFSHRHLSLLEHPSEDHINIP